MGIYTLSVMVEDVLSKKKWQAHDDTQCIASGVLVVDDTQRV